MTPSQHIESRFTLDTSGAVKVFERIPIAVSEYDGLGAPVVRWPDLSPFAQGYVEAMLRPPIRSELKAFEGMSVGFSDLAPETLAAILKDCAAYRADATRPPMLRTSHEKKGLFFWEMRQQGHLSDFPPLTLFIGDDGKVRFREAARPSEADVKGPGKP